MILKQTVLISNFALFEEDNGCQYARQTKFALYNKLTVPQNKWQFIIINDTLRSLSKYH